MKLHEYMDINKLEVAITVAANFAVRWRIFK